MTMRQRLAHIALGGVLVLSGMIASSFLQTADSQQSHTEIVKAREFHVVNESGATTAIIASFSAGLTIQNAAGKRAAIITAGPDGGSLVTLNAEGKLATIIAAESDGGALYINNAAGNTVASIAANPNGGSLLIDNAESKSRAGMRVDEDGNGLAFTLDKNGNLQLLD